MCGFFKISVCYFNFVIMFTFTSNCTESSWSLSFGTASGSPPVTPLPPANEVSRLCSATDAVIVVTLLSYI